MSSTEKVSPRIGEDWKALLQEEFEAPYFEGLKDLLKKEKKEHTVYPPGDRIFAAFDHTSFSDVRVVILGQDPYHGPGQANGLCFSVFDGVQHPPSLVNILKELESDLGIPYPHSGDLSKWARQGVLLLNATLTVRKGEAGSHRGQGWERFTDAVVRKLSEEKSGLVFLLWGRQAQQKGEVVDPFEHHVLKAPHPSPFSAHKGFFGCRHFSKTNEILKEEGHEPIDWRLDDALSS
jgi:uracil-DNA glycosylase